jgi:hypothetical protein
VNGAIEPTVDLSAGGSISHVYASSYGVDAFKLEGVIADGIEAYSNAGYGMDVYASPAGTIVRNSIARADGGGAAIQVKDRLAGSTSILGVTALGTNGGAGIMIKSTQSSTAIKNTITRGTSLDVDKKQTAIAPSVSYSNVRAANAPGATMGAGNQDGAPDFVDQAGGDLRVMSGSPTVDAGANDALSGGHDFAGASRPLGAGFDIGAYELDAANPPTRPAPTTSGGTGGTGSTGPAGSDPATSGGGDSGAADGQPAALPPAAPPVLGATVTLGESKGALYVRLPGTGTFVPLTADSTVPVGAVIDARKGTIELTSVRDASGRTQTGLFSGGVFQVRQSRTDTITELALSGGDFGACKTPRRRGKVVAAGSRHRSAVRRLWGRDRGGRFRTRGRHGSATVRGTKWLTEDRCEGTYFRVAQGAIDVRDNEAHRTVAVKRGQSYLTRPHDPARKRGRRSKKR